jgi:hypothetical protein
MKDLKNSILAVKSIDPIVGNDDTEGTGVGVDLAGFEGALMVAHLGASLDTLSGSVYVTVKFQESDDNSAFTDVADADLLGGANGVVVDAAAEDEVVIQRGYIGKKRYIRVIIDHTGTHTNGFPYSALVLKGFPRHAPVS